MKKIIVIGAVLLVAACKEEVKTAQYYVDNIDIAREKLADCQSSGDIYDAENLNCQNAKAGVSHYDFYNSDKEETKKMLYENLMKFNENNK